MKTITLPATITLAPSSKPGCHRVTVTDAQPTPQEGEKDDAPARFASPWHLDVPDVAGLANPCKATIILQMPDAADDAHAPAPTPNPASPE